MRITDVKLTRRKLTDSLVYKVRDHISDRVPAVREHYVVLIGSILNQQTTSEQLIIITDTFKTILETETVPSVLVQLFSCVTTFFAVSKQPSLNDSVIRSILRYIHTAKDKDIITTALNSMHTVVYACVSHDCINSIIAECTFLIYYVLPEVPEVRDPLENFISNKSFSLILHAASREPTEPIAEFIHLCRSQFVYISARQKAYQQ